MITAVTWLLCAFVDVEVHAPHGKQSVQRLELEDYVARVVASELDLAAPATALDVQAVLARTYAQTQAGRHPNGRLCNRAHCQRMKTKPSALALDKGRAAAARTNGQILVDDAGRPVEVTYFADCGGRTADPKLVFGAKTSEAAPIGDIEHEHSTFALTVSDEQMREAFGASATDLLFDTADDGRLIRVRAATTDRSVGGDAFIQRLDHAVGGGKVLSNLVRITRTAPGRWRIEGRGRGHGVGLCQLGTIARATRGDSLASIVTAYFPKAHLSPMAEHAQTR